MKRIFLFFLIFVGMFLLLTACPKTTTSNFVLIMLETEGEGTVEPTIGEHTYPEGTEVTLKATPSENWEFKKWCVNGTEYSQDEIAKLEMDSEKEVQAFFEEKEVPTPTKYTLTMLEPVGEGAIEPASGAHEYEDGAEITLVATPDEGWEFDKWIINGEEETESITSITMSMDATTQAFFEEKEEPTPTKYTLTMLEPVGEGEIKPASGTHEYEDGAEITLVATPDEGWEFDKWIINGEEETESITSITMSMDATAQAYFEEKEEPTPTKYTLTMLEPVGEGETEPASGTYEYEEGTLVTVSATTTHENWDFLKWQVNGIDYSISEKANFIMNGNKTVQAFFAEYVPDEYTLVAIPYGEGSIRIDPKKEKYESGEVVELTAIPEEKAYFSYWTGDIEPTPYPKIELTMDKNKTVYAVFESKDEPPTIEIVSPSPLPACSINGSETIAFSFHSNNVNVDICEVTTEVNRGTGVLDYKINEETGNGTLTWEFGSVDCEIFGATITVVDCNDNVAKKVIEISVDNTSPRITLDEGNLSGKAFFEESFTSNPYNDATLTREPTPCNNGTQTLINWDVEDNCLTKFGDIVNMFGLESCGLSTETEIAILLISKNSTITLNATSQSITDCLVGQGIVDEFFRPKSTDFNTSEDYEPQQNNYEPNIDDLWVTFVEASDEATIVYENTDCEDIIVAMMAFDICPDLNPMNQSNELREYRVDNVPPVIEEFSTDLNPECNSATYTEIKWDIKDESFGEDPQDCEVATITVSHGYINENFDATSGGTSVSTNMASGSIYWFFEDVDCEDITATLTAQDICCGCLELKNISEATLTYRVDNVPPELDFDIFMNYDYNPAEIWPSWHATDGCFDEVCITTNFTEWASCDPTKETTGPFPPFTWNLPELTDATDLVATATARDNCGNETVVTDIIPVYTLTMTSTPAEGGDIEPIEGVYYHPENRELSLIATPATDFIFSRWEVNESFYSDEAATSLIMDSDKEVKAIFDEDTVMAFTSETVNVDSGQVFSVFISIEEVENLKSALFKLDIGSLEFIEAIPAGIYSSAQVFGSSVVGTELTVDTATTMNPVSGSGNILELRFRATTSTSLEILETTVLKDASLPVPQTIDYRLLSFICNVQVN